MDFQNIQIPNVPAALTTVPLPEPSIDEVLETIRSSSNSQKHRIVMAFDTETTGVILSTSYIVQLSYIMYNTHTHELIKFVNRIIKLDPDVTIPLETIKIHGITREISDQYGKPIHMVLESFYEDYRSCDLLIAHNIKFDVNMINMEFQRHWSKFYRTHPYALCLFNPTFMKHEGIATLCTMNSTTGLCRIPHKNPRNSPYKYPTLLELYEYLFHNKPENLHNAYVDCLVCLRSYLKIWHDYTIPDREFEVLLTINMH
jgi:DNA polymerase III epsilon subunit-like protein